MNHIDSSVSNHINSSVSNDIDSAVSNPKRGDNLGHIEPVTSTSLISTDENLAHIEPTILLSVPDLPTKDNLAHI